MDKETLSNYGWIVILVLILAVMLALATPFGNFIAGAIKATTAGFFSVNQNALGAAGIDVNGVVFTNCEHNYVPDVVVDCDTTGTINYTCDKCGDTYTEERETAKHTFDGPSDLECNDCGTTFSEYAFKASDYDAKMGTTTATDTNVVIPETFEYNGVKYKVTSIGYGAFQDCSSLTSITIPDGVTSIGSYAFAGCKGLTSITIPNSVTKIGSSTFDGCKGLTTINIPDSVTSMGEYAFENCSSLTSITIPDSVTTIGNYAFLYCKSLTSITIPDSVTSIGIQTFRECSNLTSITIPDSVTSIGSSAFNGCPRLTSITIPNSVTSIGDWAFYNCPRLTDVYYTGTQEQWNAITIDATGNNCLTYATKHYNYVP